MKGPSILLVIIITMVILSGCTSPAAPGEAVTVARTPTGVAEKAQPKAAWAERWDNVVAAARKEGRVTVYTTANPATNQGLKEAFSQRYGLDIDFVVGRGEEYAQKIATERQAGLYLGDVVIAGTSTQELVMKPLGVLADIEPLLVLPEVTDASLWLDKKLPFADKERQIIAFIAKVGVYIVVNTDMVKEGEIKSYLDLVNPRWKGKVLLGDPTVTGAARSWATMLGVFVWDFDRLEQYLKDLAKQEPAILRDKRTEAEWVARGKYALGIGPDMQTVNEFMSLGAPLRWVKAVEGGLLAPAGGTVAILNRAAHPNTTTVFLNWLLSKEGQTVFVKGYGMPSARTDVPTTGIDPVLIPQPGEVLFTENLEYFNTMSKTTEVAKRALGSLIR